MSLNNNHALTHTLNSINTINHLRNLNNINSVDHLNNMNSTHLQNNNHRSSSREQHSLNSHPATTLSGLKSSITPP